MWRGRPKWFDGIDLLFTLGAGEPREDGAPLRVVLYEMPACLVLNRGLDGKPLGFRIFNVGDRNSARIY